jgi:hypothetical protein
MPRGKSAPGGNLFYRRKQSWRADEFVNKSTLQLVSTFFIISHQLQSVSTFESKSVWRHCLLGMWQSCNISSLPHSRSLEQNCNIGLDFCFVLRGHFVDLEIVTMPNCQYLFGWLLVFTS